MTDNNELTTSGPPPPASKGSRGRSILVALIACVFVFLDVEMFTLQRYQPSQMEYDNNQHSVVRQTQVIQRVQQQQLIDQLDLLRSNATVIVDGPVEIHFTVTIENSTTQQQRTNTNADINANAKANANADSGINETLATAVVEEINIDNPHFSEEIDASIYPRACMIHNTRRWLEGTRISNADTNMTDEYLDHLINTTRLLNHPDPITAMTICHRNSTFRSPTVITNWDLTNEDLLTEWQFRLTYLAIHHHMHKPALLELQARRDCGTPIPNVGNMDFECKNATFLVSNVASSGLGASFRLGAVASLWMGIATNRITVFINNSTVGPKFLRMPWPLAGCDRKDLQCFFLPPTPCVLTLEDIQNATVLPEENARDLRRSGVIKSEYQQQRILIVETRTNTPIGKYRIQIAVREGLYKNAMSMIDDISDPQQKAFLQTAAKRILDSDQLDGASKPTQLTGNFTHYGYTMKTTHFPHAFLLYAMRPNIAYQAWSNDIVATALPDDLDPNTVIGLPVRGSDKCRSESICLKYELYMELIQWTHDSMFKNSTKAIKVILTTEDGGIFNSTKAYQTRDDFPFEFLTNDQDVLQGSGAPRDYKDQADSVMLMTIVALKMQLHGRVVYGNCCSNFHLMLFDMLREGCGAHKSPILSCLQEHPDRRFNICCGWTRTDECDVTREEIKAKREVERKAADRYL
jgi:hypothetical protein